MIEQILEADRYLQVDQVDKARDMYERVVELDPGNAIAVVGLARCALADGDDQEAHRLASRALEIDPENDMARRMEARLSEILATRGETVDRPGAAATPSSREMRPVVTEEAPEEASEEAPEETPREDTSPGAAPVLTTANADVGDTVDPAPTIPGAAKVTAAPSTSKPRPIPSPVPAKETAVRKSLFDRLLGR